MTVMEQAVMELAVMMRSHGWRLRHRRCRGAPAAGPANRPDSWL